MHDTGDHEGQHIRRKGSQEHRKTCIEGKDSGDKAGVREIHAECTENDHRNQNLQGTDDRLIDHMGCQIRTDMKPCPVLTLDDVSFLADHLDRVEHPVPDTHTDQCEGTVLGIFHVPEHLAAEDIHDQVGDNRGHGKHFPVHFVDKHTELFTQVNRNLLKAVFVLHPARNSVPFIR